MKTIPLPILHFSGYPLPLAEVVIQNTTAENIKRDWVYSAEQEQSAVDSPDNWDESWFANYE
ncbi:hypothetical protein HRH25_13685 [Flavisolibacter sp. BT320]|nr:hypothetical protein [Flavisolibacter longurius]